MSELAAPLEPASLDREELARRWEEAVNDPVLRNLPYRMKPRSRKRQNCVSK